MAEGLVTDLIKQLVSIAAQQVKQEIRLVVGVKKEIQKLEDNLETVQAVINDAEKRRVKEEAVKVWLEKLNNVCYEMEDVVDEWNTELIKSAIRKEEEEKNASNAPVIEKKQSRRLKIRQLSSKEIGSVSSEIERRKEREAHRFSSRKYYEEDFDEDDDQKEESNEDEVDEEFDEDDDQKEESNEDEVDEEEDDKALHDKKEDDEAEHL